MGKASRLRKKLHSEPIKLPAKGGEVTVSATKSSNPKASIDKDIRTSSIGKSEQKAVKAPTQFPWGSNVTKEGSRGQRKRRKVKERAVLKLDLVKRVKKHVDIQKHGKALGDVGDLADVLHSVQESETIHAAKVNEPVARKLKPAKRMRNKRRSMVQNEEVSLFKQVLAHPQFQQNAVSAIHTHLENTVVAEAQGL